MIKKTKTKQNKNLKNNQTKERTWLEKKKRVNKVRLLLSVLNYVFKVKTKIMTPSRVVTYVEKIFKTIINGRE